ncbi:hypothetical protein SAMN05920897_10722 [Alkalispirochaeta americana]|uniref:Mannose or cellobiose epimerase, N-acyl-D-glucosamine 2-epimerase family n=1 Tax=Alkalispirochaeta americana TaxID=159291 RepID=A0A1N6RUH8_9SPIO|nr:hypothetical protein [Alkalispirochaeta americana]SIQ32431.1 hypothetical protein SAMN05920897_10722 [Alkalispirochaeta americana]
MNSQKISLKKNDLLLQVAERYFADRDLSRLALEGLPPGHNGPYRHPETPLRVVSHWALVTAFLYRLSGETRWHQVCCALRDYILSDAARPQGGNVYHREIEGKDRCNGLIGPAWTMEALTALGDALQDQACHDLARKLADLHPFDESWGLWRVVDLDGTVLGFDNTFNHQLWFASAAAFVADDNDSSSPVLRQVRRFLDATEQNLHIYPDGLIYHFTARRLPKAGPGDPLPERFRQALKNILKPDPGPPREVTAPQRMKWTGYHQFNLYAFARLHERFPGHPLWTRGDFRRAVALLLAPSYREELAEPENIYSFGYNPPGFEIPYALERLGDLTPEELEEERSFWLEQQISATFDPRTGQFSRGTADPATLTARICELTRWSER